MNIRDQKCTEIKLKKSNYRGDDDNRFGEKILREVKRHKVIVDRYNKIETCDTFTYPGGNTCHN